MAEESKLTSKHCVQIKSMGGVLKEQPGGEKKKRREKQRRCWEVKTTQSASLKNLRLPSVETASHAWFVMSTAGWNPCAGLQKLPGTHAHTHSLSLTLFFL